MSKAPDYYDILGINGNALPSEVNKAYRKLAVQHHPDKNLDTVQESQDKFHKIGEAYAVLNDPVLRREYDTERHKQSLNHLYYSHFQSTASSEMHKRTWSETEGVNNNSNNNNGTRRVVRRKRISNYHGCRVVRCTTLLYDDGSEESFVEETTVT